MLTTARKLRLATMAFRLVMVIRQLTGLGTEVIVTRRGIKWNLNLREGIDFSTYLLGGFELSTLRFYKTILKPGDVVLDIGANIGAHTLPLAALVGSTGKVYAFEPTAYAYKKLVANIDLNPHLHGIIQPLQLMLVADRAQPLEPEIFSSWPLDDKGDLHHLHGGKLMSTEGASRKALDEFIQEIGIQEVNFVKIDVDGNEYDVVQGARQLLSNCRPKIVMELAPYLCQDNFGSFHGLIDTFRALNYTFLDVKSGRQLSMEASLLREIIPKGASMNIIAHP